MTSLCPCTDRIYTGTDLDVGHHECGGDVHLDEHAEEGDEGPGPGLSPLVQHQAHQESQDEGVDGQEPAVKIFQT